jgi:hypothetical protein
MVAYKSFLPDPDYSDPDDEDYNRVGTWGYDDGTSRYGRGDREEAEMLLAQNDPTEEQARQYAAELGITDILPQQRPAVEANAARPDVTPRPMAPTGPAPVNETADASGGVQIPRESRIAWVHNNPGNLVFVGQDGAVKGEPKEGGGNWAHFETPESGYAALQRQIELDAGRGLTLGQFVNKFAPAYENDTDTYIKKVGGLSGATADTPVKDINPDLLARAVAKHESSTTIGGAPSAGQPPPSPGMPSPTSGIPGSLGGVPLAGAQLDGVPLTPEQIEEKQRGIMNRTHETVGALHLAGAERSKGRQEVIDYLEQERVRRTTDAAEEERRQLQIKTEAEGKVQQAMATQLDPGRVIRGMSTGDKALGFLAILAGGMAQGIGRYLGDRNATNMALDNLNKTINDDIDMQKEDKRSRVAHWTRVFGDADSGIKAAKAEMLNAAGLTLQAKAMRIEQVDIQAQVAQQGQQLIAQGQAEAAAIVEKEKARLTLKYAPPEPPKGGVGALGGVPSLAPVGLEDRDPQTREALANAYNAQSPTDRSQMNTLTKEMQEITKLEQNLTRLESAYGVRAENGKYPDSVATADGDKVNPYGSTATGPWWNVADALTPDDDRDRSIRDLWSAVELDTRSGWVTEPNGETVQTRLSGVDQPKRDEEVPRKLDALSQEIERRKQAIFSGTNAPVRAAWKYQNQYPITAERRKKLVTGAIVEQ